jgi:hypothetical protein
MRHAAWYIKLYKKIKKPKQKRISVPYMLLKHNLDAKIKLWGERP